MKKWAGALGIVILGLGIGFVAGYDLRSIVTASIGPLILMGPANGHSFTKVSNALALLGAAEQSAAGCGGKPDGGSTLANEKKAVAVLAEIAKDSGTARPMVDAATARLATRTLLEEEGRQSGAQLSSLALQATELAAAAGWKDSSEIHLREVISALDKDYCGQTLPPGDIGQ